MIKIAHKSSIIASVRTKILRLAGIFLPKSAITPTAKAISVAVGIAQPFIATASPQLMIENIIAGIITPPKAAKLGSRI